MHGASLKTDTRTRIIEAARDLYIEHGSEALSMRKIGKRVGISAAAIYRHFPDKEHLLLEVCQEGFVLFGASLMQGLRGKTPRERLMWTGRGYMRFALEHPAYYRVIFATPHPSFTALKNEAGQSFTPTFQLLVDRVGECQRAGVMREQAPESIALAIWAHVHGAVMLWLDGHLGWIETPEAFEAFFTDYASGFIASFAPTP
jgi:AcrR family transcriptional regulator